MYFFQKHDIKKQWFQGQKLEKYIKSKNALKSALGAFNQEIWAIFIFNKIHKKTQISDLSPPGKDPRWFFLTKKAYQPLRNIVIFSKKIVSKNNDYTIKITWKIQKVQKCPQKCSKCLKSRYEPFNFITKFEKNHKYN